MLMYIESLKSVESSMFLSRLIIHNRRPEKLGEEKIRIQILSSTAIFRGFKTDKFPFVHHSNFAGFRISILHMLLPAVLKFKILSSLVLKKD